VGYRFSGSRILGYSKRDEKIGEKNPSSQQGAILNTDDVVLDVIRRFAVQLEVDLLQNM